MSFDLEWLAKGIMGAGGTIADMFAKKYGLEEDERREKERFDRESTFRAGESDKDRAFRMEVMGKQAEMDKEFYTYKKDVDSQRDLFFNSPGVQELMQSDDPTKQAFAARMVRKFGTYEEMDKEDWDYTINNLAPDGRMAFMGMNQKIMDLNRDLKYRQEYLGMQKKLYESKSEYYDERSKNLMDGDPVKLAKELSKIDRETLDVQDKISKIKTSTEYAFAKSQRDKDGKISSPVLQQKFDRWNEELGVLEEQLNTNKYLRSMFEPKGQPGQGGQGGPPPPGGDQDKSSVLTRFFEEGAKRKGVTVQEAMAEFAKLPEKEQEQRINAWLSRRPMPGGEGR